MCSSTARVSCPRPCTYGSGWSLKRAVSLQSEDKAQSPVLARDWPAPGAFLLQQGGVSQHDDPVSVHTVCMYSCYVMVSLKALYEILFFFFLLNSVFHALIDWGIVLSCFSLGL